MFTALFWKDTAERAFFTALQVLLAIMTADGFDLLQLDWATAAVTILTAVLAVVVKAGIAAKVVDDSVSPASFASDGRRL